MTQEIMPRGAGLALDCDLRLFGIKKQVQGAELLARLGGGPGGQHNFHSRGKRACPPSLRQATAYV